MMQNPPPELRQDEMDMLKRLRNVGMSMAKDPQTGMPLNNMSGALGALGDAMPMRGRGTTATDNIQADMMNRKDNM